tara:strand:+ start:60 stop:1385 length:1326 start_codon:yes stop_codon:yes gene_type:complete
MKILIAFHDLMDLGGIINNQEDLYAGFEELGHEVRMVKLVWKSRVTGRGTKDLSTFVKGNCGMMMNQRHGWVWKQEDIIPYKSFLLMESWKRLASKYDLLIWQIPVPSKNKNNKGNTDWIELYNVPVKQIAYVHDGNFPARYPWLYEIKNRLCGIGATHPCGYQSLANIDVPRALFFTSQANQEARKCHGYRKRLPGWFSLQTFKGWKRVDDLIRAVPYMKMEGPKNLAGGGIQWYYMTSKDKVKKDYLCTVRKDPDLPTHWEGERIWERAIENGLQYLGYIQNCDREAFLSQVRFLIDPSWSKKFGAYGDHPNRVSIDALINGAIPIARDMGIAGNEGGEGEFFKAGKNFVMIPWNATPKEFAEIVDDTMHMGENTFNDILEEGRKIAALWDNRTVAQHFIDMAKGKPSGVYKKENDVGTFNDELATNSRNAIENFFGVE